MKEVYLHGFHNIHEMIFMERRRLKSIKIFLYITPVKFYNIIDYSIQNTVYKY